MPTIPPISPYGTFTGSLFQYARNLVAFESSSSSSSSAAAATTTTTSHKKCILIGGLSDGLIPTPYTKQLETACHDIGWSLVQPILSSSYLGFGNGSLERDTNEICELMTYLSAHREADQFALVGHSTGCQNAIHFLKNGQLDLIEKTKVVALQAPVSDREGPMTEPQYKENIQIAKDLLAQGKGDEMMPRSAFWAPITANRFLDLQDIGGADDFFSSDFTDEQLVERLGHVGKYASHSLKVLVAFSGSDEYVPKHICSKTLTRRMVEAMNHACKNEPNNKVQEVAGELYLDTGNHNLSEGPGDGDKFVEKVAELLRNAS